MTNAEKKKLIVINKINDEIAIYNAVCKDYKKVNKENSVIKHFDYVEGYDRGWSQAAETIYKKIVMELIELKLTICETL